MVRPNSRCSALLDALDNTESAAAHAGCLRALGSVHSSKLDSNERDTFARYLSCYDAHHELR